METSNGRRLALPLLAMLAGMAPQSALANVGTPLVWVTMLHLLVGNALIGVAEGWLLAKWTGLHKGRCGLVMVAANYFSAWLGGSLLLASLQAQVSIDVHNFRMVHVVAMVGAYVATVFLEWPFVWWATRELKWPVWKSLVASLMIQSASYAVLVLWYWSASATSLLGADVVPVSEIKLPAGVDVYYFTAPGGELRSKSLNGGYGRRYPHVASEDEGDRLIARESAHAGEWDIAIVRDRESRAVKDLDVAVPKVALAAVPKAAPERGMEDPPPSNWFNFGPAMRLRVPKESSWQFTAGFWPVEGLKAKNAQASQTKRVALETPIAAWNVRNMVHLPNDLVLFQFGRDQICVYEPATHRIALMWKGYGQLPVMQTGARLSP